MTPFSELLEKYIVRSKYPIIQLAQMSGFEATHITKFKRGERIPHDLKKLNALIEALCLSPDERLELMGYYKIERIGSTTYQEHLEVKALLESIHCISDTSIETNYFHDLKDVSTVQGENNINNVLKCLIEREVSIENGYLMIIAQPEYQFLFDILPLILRGHQTPITHLLCLQSLHKRNPSNVYNIQCLKTIMPLLISNQNYNPKYYYDELPAHVNSMTVLPYLIITSKYVFQISYGFQTAILHKDVSIHAAFIEIFKQQEKKAYNLIKTNEDIFHIFNGIYEREKHSFDTIYSIASAPCLANFFEDEVVEQVVRREIPFREELIQCYIKRRDCLLKKSIDIYAYFSEKGLRDFLATGILAELPKSICNPIPQAARKKAVVRMLEMARKNAYHPFIIEEDKMLVPETLILSAYNNGSLELRYVHPTIDNILFSLEERSLTGSVFAFLEYLKNSDLVCSEMDTIQRIQKILK